MAGTINLTPGDNPVSFLLNYDDQGNYTSLSGANGGAAAAQCAVVGYDPATGQPDPGGRTFVLSLAPGASGQTVIPAGKRFPVVINAHGRQAGFDATTS